MSSHSKLSPSSRHRWMRCPGSVREEAKFPESSSNAASIDGTHTHTCLDIAIKNPVPGIFVGRKLTDHDGEFVVDAERLERVEFALNYIKSRPGMPVAEERVDPAPILGRFDMSGTVDVQMVTDDCIELIDYKDGINPVQAKDNPQLEQYGFGVVVNREQIPRIRFTIIQPKARHKGAPGISSHEMPMWEFLAKKEQIIEEAAATDDPNAPLVPGEAQCKYCKAKGTCAALVNQTLASSGITFEDLSKEAADVEPTTLPDERIKEILEAAPLIRQMIEGVEKEALRRFKAGLPIVGLKAVHGRGTRAWSLGDAEIAEKLKKFGLPKEVIWKATLITPAQAEKATWEKRDKTKVQLTERQLRVMQTEYIKKSDGKIQIVAESDERQSVTISPAGLFADLSIPSFLQPI